MGPTLFAMNGPTPTHVEATKPLTFILGGQTDVIMGAHGELVDGKFFSLRRDGDYNDGDLAEVGSYDVSQYPYNIQFTVAAYPHDGCDEQPGCTAWLAVAGMFTVTQVRPVYRATFMLSMLGEGVSPGGTPIAGAVAGCFAVPNP